MVDKQIIKEWLDEAEKAKKAAQKIGNFVKEKLGVKI